VIGDADSGQIISLGNASRSIAYLRQMAGLEAGGAALLRASGSSRMHTAMNALTEPAADARARIGPYIAASGKQFSLVVRAGAHGLWGRASHDHDDNASPWMTLDGEDLLVEGGCYAYTRDHGERLRDISSAAHNLVTIGERNRFTPTAGSISPTVSAAPVSAVGEWEDEIVLETSWSDPLAGAIRHIRAMNFGDRLPAEFSIRDDVRFEGEHDVAIRWHFAPAWRVTRDSDDVVLTHSERPLRVRCRFDAGGSAARLVVESFRYSPIYGSALQGTVVAHVIRARDAARHLTTFTAEA
jgi:hypothetical protein